jgi:hypothetical protein
MKDERKLKYRKEEHEVLRQNEQTWFLFHTPVDKQSNKRTDFEYYFIFVSKLLLTYIFCMHYMPDISWKIRIVTTFDTQTAFKIKSTITFVFTRLTQIQVRSSVGSLLTSHNNLARWSDCYFTFYRTYYLSKNCFQRPYVILYLRTARSASVSHVLLL